MSVNAFVFLSYQCVFDCMSLCVFVMQGDVHHVTFERVWEHAKPI